MHLSREKGQGGAQVSRRTGTVVVSLKQGKHCANGEHVGILVENHIGGFWSVDR